MSSPSSDVPRRAAEFATTMDPWRLEELVEVLSKQASDLRSARRLVERRLPADQGTALLDVLSSGEFTTNLLALDAACRTARQVRRELGRTGTVWTGPPSRALATRSTRAVVGELIARATESLTLVTYASHDVADLISDLDRARLDRAVEVRIILETRDDTPDRSGPDPATALKHLPFAVPVYRWPKEQRGAKGGSMHVKCVIRDRTDVLVTSANLTSAAMERNMELGLLAQGGRTPAVIEQHFDDLIEGGVLVRVSP
jgi:cardiolipin synthase A/B